MSQNRIDLTVQSAEEEKKGGAQQLDEFDLLESKVDPRDLKTMLKIR